MRRRGTGFTGMKRSELLVWGGAVIAASGAAVLLATALSSVPEPLLVQATEAFVPEVLSFGQQIVTGVFTTEGKQVPLPPGQWVVMQSAVSQTGPRVGGIPSPVASTVLLRLHGHQVDAAVVVQANPPDTASNWGLASGCERQDFYYAHILYTSDHDSACSYVTYVTPWTISAPPVDEAWRKSMQQAVDDGWAVPPRWIGVVYRLTDPIGALQVRYLFAPAQGDARGGGAGVDQVAHLVAWSEVSWPKIQVGMHDQLKTKGATALADPASIRIAPTSKSGAPPAMERGELKTATFRMLGSLTEFAVAYVYLGSLAAATTLSVATSVAGSALGYVHDWAWSFVPNPGAEVHDLPGIGPEQPGPANP